MIISNPCQPRKIKLNQSMKRMVKMIVATYKVRYAGVVLSDKWPIRRY